MNCRHMTGDHHGRTAGRATLLVRAMDEILGTFRCGWPVLSLGWATQFRWKGYCRRGAPDLVRRDPAGEERPRPQRGHRPD